MQRKFNFPGIRLQNGNLYQAQSCTRLVQQNPKIASVLARATFMNALRQNLLIVRLDPNQTIIVPDYAPPNAITAARVLLAGLSGQKTTQIDLDQKLEWENELFEMRKI
ncbi:MAG: hypothetical protein EZS28_054248, partial [Streblomastix strix]